MCLGFLLFSFSIKKKHTRTSSASRVEIVKISNEKWKILGFYESFNSMPKTTITLNTRSRRFKIDEVRIRGRIYQGDSGNVKWFFLALNPLSKKLKNKRDRDFPEYDDEFQEKITHLIWTI